MPTPTDGIAMASLNVLPDGANVAKTWNVPPITSPVKSAVTVNAFVKPSELHARINAKLPEIAPCKFDKCGAVGAGVRVGVADGITGPPGHPTSDSWIAT